MLISVVEIKEVVLPQIKEFNTMENQEGIQEGIEIATLQEVVLVYRSSFLELEEYMLLFQVILG
jgi:hypothetical protein